MHKNHMSHHLSCNTSELQPMVQDNLEQCYFRVQCHNKSNIQ